MRGEGAPKAGAQGPVGRRQVHPADHAGRQRRRRVAGGGRLLGGLAAGDRASVLWGAVEMHRGSCRRRPWPAPVAGGGSSCRRPGGRAHRRQRAGGSGRWRTSGAVQRAAGDDQGGGEHSGRQYAEHGRAAPRPMRNCCGAMAAPWMGLWASSPAAPGAKRDGPGPVVGSASRSWPWTASLAQLGRLTFAAADGATGSAAQVSLRYVQDGRNGYRWGWIPATRAGRILAVWMSPVGGASAIPWWPTSCQLWLSAR
jgi:hypothetical protein